jgi:hypothetical protein
VIKKILSYSMIVKEKIAVGNGLRFQIQFAGRPDGRIGAKIEALPYEHTFKASKCPRDENGKFRQML